MNYIYDILLNFNDIYYDFYEWNISDNIEHIRKIPLFKISKKDLITIKNNYIKINNKFLTKILNKTEVFSNNKVGVKEYAVLFSDGEGVISVFFDTNGNSKKYSSLLIDEHSEVLDVVDTMNTIKISYNILNNNIKNEYFTRKDLERLKYIDRQLYNLNKSSDSSKLEYLYYECFGECETNKSKIIDKIKLELKDNWDKLNQKIYNFFKLTSINK